MWPNLQETTDLVTFTEEILNGKFNFLCSLSYKFSIKDYFGAVTCRRGKLIEQKQSNKIY